MMVSPLLAYGAGLGSALAYTHRDWLKAKYQEALDKALQSSNPKAVQKVAVAFGAAGFPAQAAALQGHAQALAGSGAPNVLKNPSRMSAGETLQPQLSGQSQSVGRDRRGVLTFQTDGNLVLYGPGQTVLWASNTGPKKGVSRLTMQADGNLVIYGNNGQPLWSTGTQGNPGAYLIVQGGLASIVGPRGQKLWTSPVSGAAGSPGSLPGSLPGSMPMGPAAHFPGMLHPQFDSRHFEPHFDSRRSEPRWEHAQAPAPAPILIPYNPPHPHWAPPPVATSSGLPNVSPVYSAPPPTSQSSSQDVTPLSMVSPSVLQDSGGAADASLDSAPDESVSPAPADDVGFGFGAFG